MESQLHLSKQQLLFPTLLLYSMGFEIQDFPKGSGLNHLTEIESKNQIIID